VAAFTAVLDARRADVESWRQLSTSTDLDR
jgi:hypothetical protein